MLYRQLAALFCFAAICVLMTGCESETTPDPTEDPVAETSDSETPKGEQAESTPDGADPKLPPVDRMKPVVAFQTSLGTFQVELNREKALITVDNFLEYVKSGFYNETVFHEVLSDDTKIIIGGQYATGMIPKETDKKEILNEAHNGLKNVKGTITMARDPNVIGSATSVFFINVADHPGYDHIPAEGYAEISPEQYGYCVFGKVISGMDIVEKINAVKVTSQGENLPSCPATEVIIRSVKRVR